MLVRIPGSAKMIYLGLRGSCKCTSRPICLPDLLDLFCFLLFISHQFFPFGFLINQCSAVVEVADMGSLGSLLCKWLGCPPLVYPGTGEYKVCDLYGQLLRGML